MKKYKQSIGVVTKIKAEPFMAFNKWWVKVEYRSNGRILNTELMFKSIDSALKVNVGFEFDC